MHIGYQILSFDTYQTIICAILAVVAIAVASSAGEVFDEDDAS